MALIMEFMNDSCNIKVFDDCIRNEEEVRKIINTVSGFVVKEGFDKFMKNEQKVKYNKT